MAAAIASAAKPDRSQARPKSARVSHKSPRFMLDLAQFPRDIFAQLLEHTRDGRFDVLGGRTVFQLLGEGIEQKLLFACLARRDHGSYLVPIGPCFCELGLGFCGIARSVSGINRTQRSSHLIERAARLRLLLRRRRPSDPCTIPSVVTQSRKCAAPRKQSRYNKTITQAVYVHSCPPLHRAP